MKRTHVSLYYLIGYLIPGGIALLTFPQFTLKLFFTDTDYGDVLPRFVGMLMLYLYSGDPLFITLLVVVGVGVVLTGTSYWLDKRSKCYL